MLFYNNYIVYCNVYCGVFIEKYVHAKFRVYWLLCECVSHLCPYYTLWSEAVVVVNPWRACAARIRVLILCVCVCVCVCLSVSCNLSISQIMRPARNTNGFSVTWTVN